MHDIMCMGEGGFSVENGSVGGTFDDRITRVVSMV